MARIVYVDPEGKWIRIAGRHDEVEEFDRFMLVASERGTGTDAGAWFLRADVTAAELTSLFGLDDEEELWSWVAVQPDHVPFLQQRTSHTIDLTRWDYAVSAELHELLLGMPIQE
jgi:hypothetical protein